MTEFDTHSTDEVTCPHCGYEFSESYEFPGEYGGSEGNIGPLECEDCGKSFKAYRNVSISYSMWLPQSQLEMARKHSL